MDRIENISACDFNEFIDWLQAHEDYPKLYQQFLREMELR